MAGASAEFNKLVEKWITQMKASNPPFTDEEIREVAVATIKAKLAMNLLSDAELFRVERMVLKVDLECDLDRHQLGEFFYPEKWFSRLSYEKKSQVTAYIATQPFKLKSQPARLIWCGPKKEAFRFEKPLHPVTSR